MQRGTGVAVRSYPDIGRAARRKITALASGVEVARRGTVSSICDGGAMGRTPDNPRGRPLVRATIETGGSRPIAELRSCGIGHRGEVDVWRDAYPPRWIRDIPHQNGMSSADTVNDPV